MGTNFAVVGQWKGGSKEPIGLKVFAFDDAVGRLLLKSTSVEAAVPGQLCADGRKGVIYAVNEQACRADGGASIHAFRLDRETGTAAPIGGVRALASYPCSICMDSSGKYLLVSHNADKQQVTKILKHPNGTYTSRPVYDDAALALYRLDADGGIGALCDADVIPNPDLQSGQEPAPPEASAHLHCVAASPNGPFAAACDTGLDKVYLYQIKGEQLVRVCEAAEAPGEKLRFCAFHPTKPWLYVNCENSARIYVYRVDTVAGTLEKLQAFDMQQGPAAGSNDILVSPQGTQVYCTRLTNEICVMDIAEDGTLCAVQTADCHGVRPRALGMTPDGAFLLCGNNVSASITLFSVSNAGELKFMGTAAEDVLPAAICFL